MQTEILRRYALALALVPDPDAAGDLFMDSVSEAELRRKALAWRRAQGFPDLTADPPLPVLSLDQQEHALHLAGRSRRRRVMRRFGLVGGGLLFLALITVGGTVIARGTLVPPLPAWANDPIFSGSAPGQQTVNQVTFRVYKSQATPGLLEVWWSASGPGTLKAWQELAPAATLTTSAGEVATAPLRNETARIGREQVRGHSTYRVVTVGAKTLVMQLDRAGDRQVGAKIWTAIGWRAVDDPEAVAYELPKPPDGWMNAFVPTTIKVAPGYAAVTYDCSVGVPTGVRGGQLVAGNLALRYIGSEPISDRTKVEYFEAPPAGTTTLTVLAQNGWYRRKSENVNLPGTSDGVAVRQRGTDPVIVISNTANPTVFFSLPGSARDEHGKSYPLSFGDNQPGSDLTVLVPALPAGTRLVSASFIGIEQVPDPRLSVKLTQQP